MAHSGAGSSVPAPETDDSSFDSLSPTRSTAASKEVRSSADGPRKRQQIKLACNGCRKRKTKCSGDRPSCVLCAARGLECNYDAITDTTRLLALRRKHNTLRDESSDLRELVRLLKDRSHDESQAMLGRLRSGRDVESILRDAEVSSLPARMQTFGSAFNTAVLANIGPSDEQAEMRSHDDLDHGPYVPAKTPYGHVDPALVDPFLVESERLADAAASAPLDSSGRGLLMDVHPLYDESLRHVLPSLWTSVPVSNVVVANLISVYLSWAHPLFTLFDERYFLRDLVSGGREFCTPLLVNVVCCFACLLYTSIDETAQPLSHLFLKQSRRLWKTEHVASVTTVSAAALLSLTTIFHNSHKEGMSLLAQGYQYARQLGMFNEQRESDELRDGSEQSEPAETKSAACAAAWGIFNLSSTFGLSYPIPPICPTKPALPPSFDDFDVGQPRMLWPCGRSLQHVPSHYKYVCQLSEMINDCVALRQRIMASGSASRIVDDPTSHQAALLILKRLVSWRTSLPSELKQTDKASPAWLDLLMTPHAAILEVFRPFIHIDRNALKLYSASARSLNLLLATSRRLWGGPPNLVAAVNLVHKSSFAALQIIPQDAEAEMFFMNCIDILNEISTASTLHLRILHGSLVASKKKLIVFPDKAEVILGRLEANSDEVDTLDSSMFMIDLDMAQQDPEAASLESLIKNSQALRLAY